MGVWGVDDVDAIAYGLSRSLCAQRGVTGVLPPVVHGASGESRMPKTWMVMVTKRRGVIRRPRRWLPQGKSVFFILTPRLEFVMSAVSRRGIIVAERWPRHVRLGSLSGPPWSQEWPQMKKKLKATEGESVKHLAAVETKLFGELFSLVEHCCVRKYDDGDSREPGWFTVKTQGAAWCVQVKDPDACVSFTAVGDTLDKAIETANLLLSCDEAPWEPDQFLMRMRAEKKKK